MANYVQFQSSPNRFGHCDRRYINCWLLILHNCRLSFSLEKVGS